VDEAVGSPVLRRGEGRRGGREAVRRCSALWNRRAAELQGTAGAVAGAGECRRGEVAAALGGRGTRGQAGTRGVDERGALGRRGAVGPSTASTGRKVPRRRAA